MKLEMIKALSYVRKATITWLHNCPCTCTACHELRIALEKLRIAEEKEREK